MVTEQPRLVLTQLNFKLREVNNCSVILQYSIDIGWPHVHKSNFPLQSWHIWWRFIQRYHCFFSGLARSSHTWQTKLLCISVSVLLESSRDAAILTHFFVEFGRIQNTVAGASDWGGSTSLQICNAAIEGADGGQFWLEWWAITRIVQIKHAKPTRQNTEAVVSNVILATAKLASPYKLCLGAQTCTLTC